MNAKEYIKNYWLNGLMIIILALLLLVPDTKVWVLQRLLDIGLFRATAHKEIPSKNTDTSMVQLYFTDANNKITGTNDLRGKVVFINYWATWCPPCRAEMPSINSLYLKLSNDDRFVFIIADADGNLLNSGEFMRANNFSLPLYKPYGEIKTEVFSGTLPTTIIMDPEGHIVNRNEGIENYNTGEMLAYLKSFFK